MKKKGHKEMRPGYDYHVVENIVQASTTNRNLEVNTVPSLLPENHIRRTVKAIL